MNQPEEGLEALRQRAEELKVICIDVVFGCYLSDIFQASEFIVVPEMGIAGIKLGKYTSLVSFSYFITRIIYFISQDSLVPIKYQMPVLL